jgi:hypothetical protein
VNSVVQTSAATIFFLGISIWCFFERSGRVDRNVLSTSTTKRERPAAGKMGSGQTAMRRRLEEAATSLPSHRPHRVSDGKQHRRHAFTSQQEPGPQGDPALVF